MLISATTAMIGPQCQRFPNETPFVFRPYLESGEQFERGSTTMALLNDYNLLDLSI